VNNTGTWNGDLVLMFSAFFFFPMIAYFVFGIFLKIGELNEKHYVINVYQEQEYESKKVSPTLNQARKPVETNPIIEQVASESIAGLVGMGYKKSEARRKVAKAAINKEYKKAEDMILDIISNCV